MGKTKIEWAEHRWNPVRGCSMAKGSEAGGCLNCYAARIAARFSTHALQEGDDPGGVFAGFARMTRSGPRWTGRVELIPSMLDIPLRRKKRTLYFVNSMSDLWHERLEVLDIAKVYAMMYRADWHRYLVLTKRSRRRAEIMALNTFWNFVSEFALKTCRPRAQHIGEGVSVEDQETADARIPHLLQTPAAMRFVSYEPALGPLDLGRWLTPSRYPDARPEMREMYAEAWRGQHPILDWVIAGGESGPGARPMHPDWARGVRDQCAAAGVPFFFKQWGHFRPVGCADYDSNDFDPAALFTSKEEAVVRVWPDGTADDGNDYTGRRGGWFMEPVGKKDAGRLLEGREHNDKPEGW